jgi:hypothetical protein
MAGNFAKPVPNRPERRNGRTALPGGTRTDHLENARANAKCIREKFKFSGRPPDFFQPFDTRM